MRRLAAMCFAAAVLTVGGGATSAYAISSSQLLSLEGQYMCVSCHQPLNQVYSAEAQAEKQTLAGLANQCLSSSQIKSQMVADYGPGVLAKPKSPVVYVVIGVVIVALAGLLAYTLPRWRRRARADREPEPAPPGPDLSDPEQQRLNRELEGFR